VAEEDVVLLGIAEDEDVVLPPVVLPAALVLFTDVAFCANIEIVVKFSAAIILTATMAATIKPPNLRVFSIAFFIRGILFIDWYHYIYNRNISSINASIFRFSNLKSFQTEFFLLYVEIISISKCKQFCFSNALHIQDGRARLIAMCSFMLILDCCY
jgi:hypothetical protein